MHLIRAILGFDKPNGKLSALLHECFILLVFCAFTTALTWPYVNYLRDAVADPGDPYLVSWILWWDYHQTFTDPLNLFHANLFYPLRYTLAFSENSYGIALVFFPLFALGFRPLTVHAVAMFFGFAFCGYAAFRLARTLTGSEAVGWVAGIIFAFVPFRFHLLSHLLYLFSPWIPLQFEALVLFVRKRSKTRTAWLGFAFFMNGLTCLSWFNLGLVPFVLTGIILITRYRLWNDRRFWPRAALALGLASIALLPFMLPYYYVSKLYGFTRSIEEVKANSAWPIHWLSVENRNKLWNGFGENLPEGYKFKLFPGMLPILLSLVAFLPVASLKTCRDLSSAELPWRKFWIRFLDLTILLLAVVAMLAIGFAGSASGLFRHIKSEYALTLLTVTITARLCLAYPSFLNRGTSTNLITTLRRDRFDDAFWLGSVLTTVGFCYSLGWNFFFYRVCYDLIVTFRSMRVPPRGAMFAYLGLAILAGLGAKRLAETISNRRRRISSGAIVVTVCALLLIELNAAPLKMMRGEVYPDAVTKRLKETSMHGGLAVLPAGADFNHRHVLRSADHQKPLIVGTSGFNSPYEDQIEAATLSGPISDQFLDLLEKIPTSYVVVENQLIAPERRADYEGFLARALTAERLRFVNRFDGRDDLYAVVKTEPLVKSEAPIPFKVDAVSWEQLIERDPLNILVRCRQYSQLIYRLHVASYGVMPRYTEFLPDVKTIGRGVIPNQLTDEARLDANVNEFAASWVERDKFSRLYKSLTDEQFVDRISENAELSLSAAERTAYISDLKNQVSTRAQILLALAKRPDFAKREESRSLVLLHYFGYLHRNPDDRPDKDLSGFNFWVRELETNRDTHRLPLAFIASDEYKRQKESETKDRK